MSSLLVTLPLTLLLGAVLLALVVRAARRGEYDDWEGPAARAQLDDDTTPEIEPPPGSREREPSGDRS